MTQDANQMTLKGLDQGAELLTIDERKQGAADAVSLKIVEKDEERVNAILADLAAKLSLRAIAKRHNVGYYTLQKLIDQHSEKLAALKKELANKCRLAANIMVERVLENVDSMSLDKLPLNAGILVDKAQLLDGEATSIVGHQEAKKPSDFNSYLDSIVNVTATGSEGAVEKQKGDEVMELPVAEKVEEAS